jgi:hypothetical protein
MISLSYCCSNRSDMYLLRLCLLVCPARPTLYACLLQCLSAAFFIQSYSIACLGQSAYSSGMLWSDISSAIVSSGGQIQLSVNSRRLEQLILYIIPLCSSHLHLSPRISKVKREAGCSSIIQPKRKSGRSIIRISKLLFQLDMEKSTLIPLSTSREV